MADEQEDPAETESRFTMTLSLSVLKHLGLNLYSNVPSVLAEAVSNAWDADATEVNIQVDSDNQVIAIQDNGHGMTTDEVNERYLTVGYERRASPSNATSAEFHRKVMGRKGIGKLSLFSISDKIEVRTRRGTEASAFELSRELIEDILRGDSAASYHPTELSTDASDLDPGTRITLRALRRRIDIRTVEHLRRRLSRRFSILGSTHNFDVRINGQSLSLHDRDYFHKLQFVWWFGDGVGDLRSACSNVHEDGHFLLDDKVPNPGDEGWKVSGWIGSVQRPAQLKEADGSINQVSLLVRGKLAQEDLLASMASSKLYASYLIGEVNADFLDDDEQDDIATSNRQSIVEDDPRYQGLRAFLASKLLAIESTWAALRTKAGTTRAVEFASIAEWYGTLDKDGKKRAERLFGQISRVAATVEQERLLLKHGVLAFETLRQRDALDELDKLDDGDVNGFVRVFRDLNEVEASYYHQIVSERLKVIELLQRRIEENALEKVLQQLLFENLWLLDTAWERATSSSFKEKTVLSALNKDAELSDEERKGRIDIGYRQLGGTHVIVELKRADRVMETGALSTQCGKYFRAVRNALRGTETHHEPSIEIMIVVGKDLSDWKEPEDRRTSAESLRAIHARVRTYNQLLESAHQAYREFIESRQSTSALQRVMRELDDAD
jgi:hypothetical protein